MLFILNLLLLTGPAQAAPVAPVFARVDGPNLTLNGQPIKLKGHTFYPYQAAWQLMWTAWNGPQIEAELGQAALLGDNVIRVFVPYGITGDWTIKNSGQVQPARLDQLRQFVQIAATYRMKVIVTLFDTYDQNPPAGSVEEQDNQLYLQGLIGAFANDDRVLVWDIHNEPDYYDTWNKLHQPDAVLNWLARMHDYIKRLDPNHLVTIGGGFYEHLWYTDPQGRSIVGLSDYVSLHSYNALDFGNEVFHLREHTDKPILLEETGWPTGPVNRPDFTEAAQLDLYQKAVQAVPQYSLVGMLGWMLRDQVPNGGAVASDNQYYYGVIRRNGTLKPAALVFRDGLRVSPLPSTTTSALSLTTAPQDQLTALKATYFPQTDHYVSTPFKELWRRAGGEAVFGLPLTEAYFDQLGDDGTATGPNARQVQYFERARFEYYPNRRTEPGFQKLDGLPKYFYVIDFTPLGRQFGTQAIQSSPKVTRRQPDDAKSYLYFDQTGHDLSGSFLAFWQAHNGSKLFGLPLTEPFAEPDPTRPGQTRQVQYFEQSKLEIYPDQPDTVQVAKLGELALQAQGLPTGPPPSLPKGTFADPAFQSVWQRLDGPVDGGQTGRSWLWGPVGFAVALEPYQEAQNGGNRLVQYFDKSRMEITRPDGDPASKYFVTNGLLVKELIGGQMQTGDASFEAHQPAQVAVAGDPTVVNQAAPTYASLGAVATLSPGQNQATARLGQSVTATLAKDGTVGQLGAANPSANLAHVASYQAATGHNIPDVFWRYLTQSRGPLLSPDGTLTQGDPVDWLYSVGLPLTEAYWTRAKVGGVEQDVLVQAFERRVLTYTPANPSAYQVEMGNVGRHYYQWRYSQPG